MKIKGIIAAGLALLVIVILVPWMVFSIEETELTFDTLSRQTQYNSENQDTKPGIQVITGQPLEPVPGISPSDQSMIELVDYAQYMVIVVRFGYGGSPQNNITSIKQQKGDIWIRSVIESPAADAPKFSPYQIVKIPREQIIRTGNIRFILLNGSYEEKARTVQMISSVNGPG